jgi:hypothetical protein
VLAGLVWVLGRQGVSSVDGDSVAYEQVRAHSFVLVDGAGNARAELSVLDDGTARLLVRNEGTTGAVEVAVTADGRASVALAGRTGQKLAEVGVRGGQDLPVLILRDGNGTRRLGLTAGPRGQTGIAICDSRGQTRCALVVDDEGFPSLRLGAGDARARVALQADALGNAAIDLADGADRTRITLQVDADGQPTILLFPPNEAARRLARQP